MHVTVRVPAALRPTCGDRSRVEVAVTGPVTVDEVLDALAEAHPALERRIRDERRHVRVHVNLFVGADNIRDLDGPLTAVPPDGELTIIAAVSGG